MFGCCLSCSCCEGDPPNAGINRQQIIQRSSTPCISLYDPNKTLIQNHLTPVHRIAELIFRVAQLTFSLSPLQPLHILSELSESNKREAPLTKTTQTSKCGCGLRCTLSLPSCPGAPCLLIIPTLGPKVYRHDLHWAIWSPRDAWRWRAFRGGID